MRRRSCTVHQSFFRASVASDMHASAGRPSKVAFGFCSGCHGGASVTGNCAIGSEIDMDCLAAFVMRFARRALKL